ncbi:MAG TPA: nucleoside hydrolase [Candidatus Limnocylindrales bacterium]|nr:nucleoside hydrolase [Candidatus Limnocylindrales bacterium]
MRELILDMDIGVDDAIALMYLSTKPDIRIVAVGSCHGNTGAADAAENGLRLLALCGLDDVPVAVGAVQPLVRPVNLGPEVHGADGLGNVRDTAAPATARRPVGESAAEQLVRLVRDRPGRLDVLATGPLTNLALALRLEPRLPELVGSVVIMGGAANAVGNMNPVAEANIWKDPEAARMVFEASWPLTMVGLDVTMRTILDEAAIARIAGSDRPKARLATAILRHYLDFYQSILGYERRVCPLHDPLAAGITADPTLVRRALRADVVVDCGEDARGMTIVDQRRNGGPATEPRLATEVVLEVDSERFVEDLVAALTT